MKRTDTTSESSWILLFCGWRKYILGNWQPLWPSRKEWWEDREYTYCNKNIYTVYFKHCWHWEGTKTKENLEKQGFFFTIQRFNRCRIIEQETVSVHYLDKQGQASTTLVDIASLECVTAEGICSCNYNQLGDLDSWRRDTEKKSKSGAISMKLVSW